MSNNNSIGDTIAAISTPMGEGGIGIVRLSGPGAIKVAGRIFSARDGVSPSEFKTHTIHYGHIVKKSEGQKKPLIVDEVLLTVLRAPKSYTREDTVEINCHGGWRALESILALAVENGARTADPGEFTKRAFLNGRIDLSQAEAVIDVIRAKTESSLKMALEQLEGGLSHIINAVREGLIEAAAEIEAAIDFPDEGLEAPDRSRLADSIGKSLSDLDGLIGSYGQGMVYRDGVLAVICGKPNAGKSSLMNLLLKRDRVIVSAVPGTTRDAVEETINLGGVPVRLVDTAGISDTENAIEKEGVRRSKRYLESADIVIFMIDSSVAVDGGDREIAALITGKKRVVVLNKCDLAKAADAKSVESLSGGSRVVGISVEKKTGIEILEKAVRALALSGGGRDVENAVVSNARHKEALDKARSSVLSVKKLLDGGPDGLELAAIDIKEAIFQLGLITGKSVSDDILDRIFSRFCIGK